MGIVGIALPAAHSVVGERYFLVPDEKEDLDKVEGLLFGEEELEPLP